MLFNSYEFIFLFLPVTMGVFYLIGSRSRTWALRWLIVASIFFYAWWRPLNLLIIAPSILINFVLARAIQRYHVREQHTAARAALVLGIVFNVTFLGYFKYANFGATIAHDLLGTDLVLTRIILPLGISFITFQKIAFLIDVHSGRISSFTLHDYCLFVLFFPQLIAGPIVHYREMMPQFQRATCVFDAENASVGLTLFVFGLFKKVVLADSISPYVGTLFGNAALGSSISFLPAWMAAIGFTFQIYFDFSGYTDMALGLGRFCGVRFPPNFFSPLRATSIIDFWLRWHMTLTRFLTAYIYNPLALALTRRRAARGLPVVAGRNTTIGAFVELLMFSTIVTMLISGIWHGAGYLFLLWGLLHGIYLTINHGWRLLRPRYWRDSSSYDRIMKPVGFVLTFVAVAAAMVLFRSTNTTGVVRLFAGMAGLSGIALPVSLFSHLGPLAAPLQAMGVKSGLDGGIEFNAMASWTILLAFVALACPNTLQLLSRYEPALGIKSTAGAASVVARRVQWAPSLGWAAVVSALAFVGVSHLGGLSEFLYWQF